MTAFEEILFNEDVPSEDKKEVTDFIDELPTKRQIDTIKKLSDELNMNIAYENLTKKSAGNLISKMINEKSRKH